MHLINPHYILQLATEDKIYDNALDQVESVVAKETPQEKVIRNEVLQPPPPKVSTPVSPPVPVPLSSEDEESEDEDVRDLEGRTVTAKGYEVSNFYVNVC